jgi:hypothetical protein
MSRWFRFYDDAINDPKLLRLSDAMFRAWVTLLCIASKYEGKLPPASDIALMLRTKRTTIAAWFTELTAAGLLDNVDGHFVPHNWNGRQYKSDVSTGRVKRFRETKRNVSSTVSETPPEAETETEDRIGDAGASAFTEGSKALATVFWKALGFESPLAVPPEYAGTDWRAIEWERAGWTVDLIDSVARKTGNKPLTYHEKCFATEFAKRQAPLPIVEIKQAETLTVTHGTNQNRSGGSLTASLRRDLAALEQSDGADNSLPAGGFLRLSN